jgi:hypothetical protein
VSARRVRSGGMLVGILWVLGTSGFATVRAADDPPSAAPDSLGAVSAHDLARARTMLSPGAAMALGVGVTIAPAALALALVPRGRHSSADYGAALTTGTALGVLAGPAIGLWSGGRGDLAAKGLVVRGIGVALAGASAAALFHSESISPEAGVGVVLLATAAGLAATVSCVHDLAHTPAAVTARQGGRAGLELRSDGRVALSVRF